MIEASKIIDVTVRSKEALQHPKVRFRMVLDNEDYARYSAMRPPICVALYNKIYPISIAKGCIGRESELSAWCRLSGMAEGSMVRRKREVGGHMAYRPKYDGRKKLHKQHIEACRAAQEAGYSYTWLWRGCGISYVVSHLTPGDSIGLYSR
jgi:hypothetical protein